VALTLWELSTSTAVPDTTHYLIIHPTQKSTFLIYSDTHKLYISLVNSISAPQDIQLY